MLLVDLFERKSDLYLNRKLRNADAIHKWMAEQGIPTAQRKVDMHVTITYSKSTIDWSKTDKLDDDLKITKGARTVEKFGDDAVVLTFESDELQSRWKDIQKMGAKTSFPTYRPHVTLTYELPKGFDIKAIKPYEGELVFGPERWEPIDSGWQDDATEVVLKKKV